MKNVNNRLAKMLDEAAENFSYYSQDFEDYSQQFENYTGYNDPFVDYVSGFSFATHNDGARTFTISITGTTENQKSILQLFGDLNVGAEDPAYEFITDKNLSGGLAMTGNPSTIKRLYAWLQNNPTILQGVQLVSSDSTILSGNIDRRTVSPFRQMATDPLPLSTFRNEYQFQNGILTIQNLNDVISNQTYWLITIPPGTAFTLTINLYFGAALNLSKALVDKKNKAFRNIQNFGGANVVKALESRQSFTLNPALAQQVTLPGNLNKVANLNNVSVGKKLNPNIISNGAALKAKLANNTPYYVEESTQIIPLNNGLSV